MDKRIVAAVLFGIFLSFIFIESFLRITSDYLPKPQPFITDDDFIGYKLKPNVELFAYNQGDNIQYKVKTVDLGFKDIGFRDDGVNGSVYAVAVGDSTTFGSSVELENVWTEVLERNMGKDVVNMGVGGYSTLQEKKFLEKYGVKLKPKVVFLGFFLNDFIDSFGAENEEKGTLGISEILKKNIATYAYAHAGLSRFVALSSAIYYKDSMLDLVLIPRHWKNSINPNNPAVKTGENITKTEILKMNEIANDNNAEFIIVIIPSREHIYRHILEKLNVDIDGFDLDYPIDSMKIFCSENNLKCLDLTPALREYASEGEQLAFRMDGHMNELGNRRMAEIIQNYLEGENLLAK